MAARKDLVALRGHVIRLGHQNPATGFRVFTVRALKDSRKVIQVSGVLESSPRIDDAVEIFGYFDTQSTYKGIQFKATGFSHISGLDELQIARFLTSFAKFLGDIKAREIAAYFGPTLEEVLENSPGRLMEVPGIGETICKNILDGWNEKKGVRSISIFLMKLGLPEYKIRDIVSHHGLGFEEKVKADPYLLMDEGIGFSACDSYAETLGIAADSAIRYRGFALSVLKTSVQAEGHLYISMRNLITAFNESNTKSHRKFHEIGVTSEDIAGPLESLIDDGYVVRDGDKLYFFEQFFYEAASAERLASMLLTPGAKTFEGIDTADFMDKYEETERFRIPEFSLADAQRDAIESFVQDKALIVTGAPGTGKTTVVRSFVKILKDYKLRFVLLAPTGKAAKRLEETAGHPAYTIHRKLGYQGDKWVYGFRNKLPVDVILVDEFSMVDQQLLYRLLDSLNPTAKIIMVGDHFQLPSVGAGNVLRDLLGSGRIKTITLTKVHRQAETSDIVKVANQIKDGSSDMGLFKLNDLKAEVVMLRTGSDIEMAEKYIVSLCKALKQKGDTSFQVISPRNEGDLSVGSLNLVLQEALNPKPESGLGSMEISLGNDVKLRMGDRVRITKNHYGLGVFNGDSGKVLLISTDTVKVAIEGGTSVVSVPVREARTLLALGYTSSVHRTQGAEFGVVILALLKSHGNNLLQRNLIYTAITRAKKKVIIVGQDGAVVSSIENDSIKNRNTALAARITESLDKATDTEFMALHPLLSVPDTAPNFVAIQKMLFPSMGRAGKDEEDGSVELMDEVEEKEDFWESSVP